MPALSTYKIMPPTDFKEFETLICDYGAKEFKGTAQLYGRQGQKQCGIDVLVTSENGDRTCIQCKDYQATKVTTKKIDEWIAEIDKIPFFVHLFVIAVVGQPDAKLIEHVAVTSDNRVKSGKCRVNIIFWDVIERFVKVTPEILSLYYPMLACHIEDAKSKQTVSYTNLILTEEELRLRFLDCVSQYHIIDFLESDPFVRIDFDLLLDLDSFIYSVSDLLNKSMDIEKTDRFIQIGEFLKSLNDYSSYLSSICGLEGNGLLHFRHEYGDMNTCKKKVDDLRKKVFRCLREVKER